MEKVTYEQLQRLLKPLGMLISDQSWAHQTNNSFLLKAEVRAYTKNDTPTLNDNGRYGALSATGKTPDEVATALFKLIKEKVILIGTYGNYTHRIIWNNETSKVEKCDLKHFELLEYNCTY